MARSSSTRRRDWKHEGVTFTPPVRGEISEAQRVASEYIVAWPSAIRSQPSFLHLFDTSSLSLFFRLSCFIDYIRFFTHSSRQPPEIRTAVLQTSSRFLIDNDLQDLLPGHNWRRCRLSTGGLEASSVRRAEHAPGRQHELGCDPFWIRNLLYASRPSLWYLFGKHACRILLVQRQHSGIRPVFV